MSRLHDPARPDRRRPDRPRESGDGTDRTSDRDGSPGSPRFDEEPGYDGASLDPTIPEETQDEPSPAGDALEQLTVDTATEEYRFILHRPDSRLAELRRIIRIGAEFVRGFRQLQFVGPCVSVFGSSRTPEGHPDYELARELGRELSRAGFTVMTGGGPGIMAAANRGARESGGRSVGSGIRLPDMEMPNEYLDTFVEFHYFFVRKVMLMKYSYAFIIMPGGFGTLDEVFEAMTLIQTRKIRDFPVILVNRAFWEPLLDFLRDLAAQGKVRREDVDRIIVTDSAQEAATLCREAAIRRFGLSYGRPERRRWWLFE